LKNKTSYMKNKQDKLEDKKRQRKPIKKTRNDDDFNWQKLSKVVLSWFAILVGVFIIMTIFKATGTQEYAIDYPVYIDLLKSGDIKEATIKKADINNYTFHGVLKEIKNLRTADGVSTNVTHFITTLPYVDGTIIQQWTEAQLKFNIVQEDNTVVNALIGILPWVAILLVWLFFMRRMQGGGTKGIFSFGKSKAKLLVGGTQRVTFQDVAGADEAKTELQEIIEFLKEPIKFQRLGGKIPRGVLLLGPPGTGKTLLARAVAGEAAVPFFSISGADFVEMFVGVGASRVRDLFETGKKSAPCIIFIDEIDAVGRHRGAGLGGGHDEREQTLNQLLVEMDGFEQNSGVIIIAATNRPDVLDPALMRPGRFDRQVVVDRPDVKGREGILKVHTRNIPLNEDVRLDILAKGTPGFAGADLANLVNEAALLAARKNCLSVSMIHFEEAKDKVMMGTERKSLIISDEERKVTAYHESGHVLVAKMTAEADPVHKVTIIPRGRALGVTTYLPIDEKHTYSKEYLMAMISYALGGRAAEKIVFDKLTTGAGNDIERATTLARKMVCEWGMSDVLGPLAYGQKEEEIFLAREITRTKNFSESTAVAIDNEIKLIVNTCMERAAEIVTNHIDKLHIISTALLEREILDGNEIDMLLRGEILPPIVTNNNNSKPPDSSASEKNEKPKEA
jgi:cell division protease FtsH